MNVEEGEVEDQEKVYRGTHGGSQARPRAIEKIQIALLWMYQCEITDMNTLAMLLGLGDSARDALWRSLKKLGYISGLWVSGCPSRIIHLTHKGRRYIQPSVAGKHYASVPVAVSPSKLNLRHVQHDLLVQRFAIEQLLKDEGLQVTFARQIRRQKLELGRGVPNTGLKVPDAYFARPSQARSGRAAVEIQQSPEPDLVAERKLSQYAEAYSRGEINGLLYVTAVPSIQKHMIKIADGEVRAFSYNDDQHRWYIRDSICSPLTPEIRKKMYFLKIMRFDYGLYPTREVAD